MRTRYKYDSTRRWGCIGVCVLYALAIAASVWLAVALSACGRTTYVPVEVARTEYRDREVERLVTDTVVDRSFVLIKGDTVIDRRERRLVRREYVHDTVSIVQTDSVAVPYPVERKLSRWEAAKMDLGGVAIGALALLLFVAVARAGIWLRGKI